MIAMHEGGITATELRHTKSYLVNSHCFEIDTPQKRLDQRVDEELFGLPRGYHDRYLERIRAVTRAEVNDALARRLTPADLAIVLVATAKDVVPKLRALPGVASVRTVPFDRD